MNDFSLEILKKSRIKPRDGDIFVVKPNGFPFYFGKVIISKINSLDINFSDMVLIFVFDFFSDIKKYCLINDKNLLISPMVINHQPWIKGFIETVGNEPVSEQERNIDFGFWDDFRKKFVNIDGQKMTNKPKYYSIRGLGSYGAIRSELEKVLVIKQKNKFV